MNPFVAFLLKGFIVNWLKSRLKEPSTHAGIGVALVALAPLVPLEYQNIVLGLAVAFGGVSVVRKDAQ